MSRSGLPHRLGGRVAISAMIAAAVTVHPILALAC